jgi:hypothetical protein
MREELVEQQGAIAEEMFCPQFLDLWKATKDPFAQPILDQHNVEIIPGELTVEDVLRMIDDANNGNNGNTP